MKRLGTTDSSDAFLSICPTSEEQCPRNNNKHVYNMEFQTMLDGLDEEGCIEESGHASEKKRRLRNDQVKALEKNFEVENKLEPDRKVKLAQELGLQPRQVAVWFQNRRARWKTKQLERDYNVLKTNFDSLKQGFETLKHDKEALLKEIRELKSKLGEDCNTECDMSVKDEKMFPESENNSDQISEEYQEQPAATYLASSGTKDLNFFDRFKDGSSDSDSSAILNEDGNSPTAAAGIMVPPPELNYSSPPPAPEAENEFGLTQFVKLEEHNFFTGDEACNFFSDEQPPTLQQWWNTC